MNGRKKSKQKAVSSERLKSGALKTVDGNYRISTAHRLPLTAHRCSGFTLLELMIVIAIMVILAAVTLPQYQRTVLQAREAVLRENLNTMRRLVDQYAADKAALPQSLDDLVANRYMHEIPVDPITNEKDWNVVMGEDPSLPGDAQGVTEIRSSSSDTSTEGTPYNEW